jgi:hypothetical protein
VSSAGRNRIGWSSITWDGWASIVPTMPELDASGRQLLKEPGSGLDDRSRAAIRMPLSAGTVRICFISPIRPFAGRTRTTIQPSSGEAPFRLLSWIARTGSLLRPWTSRPLFCCCLQSRQRSLTPAIRALCRTFKNVTVETKDGSAVKFENCR